MTPLADSERPVILRGVRPHFDKVRNMWVLLAPERALQLDDAGRAILEQVDGEKTFAEIIDTLAEKFNAPRERIAEDARAYLEGLISRRMVEAR